MPQYGRIRSMFNYLGLSLAAFLLFCGTNSLIAQTISVMQWNVHGNLGTAAAQSNAGAAAIGRILNFLQPDVLLINEVADGSVATNTASLTQWVGANLPYVLNGSFYVAVSTETSSIQRNAVVSRYPVLNPFTYADVTSSLRGMHSFQLQLDGTNRLQIFHVHLKCCSDGSSCQEKQDEAQLFSDEIAAWAATNSAPYLFAGDLNEDESNPECVLSSTYHPVTMLITNGGLAEFEPTTLSGEYRTWSTAPAAPSIRFDYILAALNRLSPSSGFVFSTMDWAAHGFYTNASAQNLVNDSQTASDHYAVLASYSFSPGAQLSLSPASGLVSTGLVGGPFNPNVQVYTLSNLQPAVLHWSATNGANWLTLSATSGTLPSGSNTTIAVSINTNANALTAGTYSDTVTFINSDSNAGNITRTVRLTVNSTNGTPFGFFDDFSTFAGGNLVGQSNWAQLSTIATQPLQISGGNLLIPAGQIADNQDAYKNFTQTSATVFYGLTLTVSDPATNASPSYFAALYTGNNGSGFANFRLTARANDAGKTNYALGIRITGQSGDPYTFGANSLRTGVVYRVIVQASGGGASMALYLNPVSSDLAAQTAYANNLIGSGTAPASVGSFVISQFSSSTAPNDGVAIGKVAVADSFAAAYTALVLTPFQSWQIQYFGSITNPAAAATADPDGDGQNNMTEFLAGTNPTNSLSAFRITAITVERSDLRITWMTAPGKTNALQRAAGLQGNVPTDFADIFTVTTGSSLTNYLDAGALTNATGQYYRVRLVP